MSSAYDLQEEIAKAPREYREAYAASKCLRFIVIGEMGTGKSTLVNGIVGKKVAAEGFGPVSITKSVSKYEEKIHGVLIEIFDTPGLGDPDIDDEDTYKEIEKLGQIDLVLLCVDIRKRLTITMIKIMKTVTKIFGWNNALFALTFANKLEKMEFDATMSNFKKEICRYLQERCKVSEPDSQDVPVVPTGHLEHSLPGIDDWLSNAWNTFFERLPNLQSKLALVKVNQTRLSKETDTRKCEPQDRKLKVKKWCIIL